MTNETMRKMACLASEDRFYLGWYLARYSEITEVNMAELATELGCLPETMASVSLCRSPRAEPPHFREDIEAVADRFQIHAGRLANVVRHVTVASEGGEATLFAARDREEIGKPDPLQDS